MRFNIFDTNIEQNLVYHSIDPEIYDNDYVKTTTLFGLFKRTHRLKLKNNMNGTTKTGEVIGFKKK